ncbi:MAG: 8-amino-7-oxononanoate synthase, partial [Sedimentisphaerales bacterium]|nr:8-amino-7-oxononanoate synthase [Sedimentisphaerales bacterium]
MGNEYYREQLSNLRNEGLYRQMRIIESPAGRLCSIEGEEKIVFCSNNYLGLANDRRIISAIKKGADDWGFGSGGSRLICGNTTPHEQLQKRLARLLKKEASLVFTSGYAVNNAILSSLPQEKDLILIDKLVHASLIDGAKAGKGQVRTYPHRNIKKLKRLLEKGGYNQAFIVTDSLFSMDGDKANLKEIAALKRKFEAVLMADEAHAFGCVGPGGEGCAAEIGVLGEVDIFVATLSKALGGAGGFVAGTQVMIDYLMNKSRGFIYTTGIPVVNCLAANAALDIVEQEPQRRQRLIENGEYFRKRCREMNLDIG